MILFAPSAPAAFGNSSSRLTCRSKNIEYLYRASARATAAYLSTRGAKKTHAALHTKVGSPPLLMRTHSTPSVNIERRSFRVRDFDNVDLRREGTLCSEGRKEEGGPTAVRWGVACVLRHQGLSTLELPFGRQHLITHSRSYILMHTVVRITTRTHVHTYTRTHTHART